MARGKPAAIIPSLREKRPWNLPLLFDDLKARAAEAEAASAKKLAQASAKFEELLLDYYYRSDHIGTTWAVASERMANRSAFKDMAPWGDAVRQGLFDAYMSRLAEKARKRAEHDAGKAAAAAAAAAAPAKKGDEDKAAKEGGGGGGGQREEGEVDVPVVLAKEGAKRPRSRSPSTDRKRMRE